MLPVPYEITEDDVDEVLGAYEPPEGGDWTEDERREAREHVMSNVLDLDEIIATAPEDAADARRELALAAIEDLLIRDGFIDIDDDESRAFPALTGGDSERND